MPNNFGDGVGHGRRDDTAAEPVIDAALRAGLHAECISAAMFTALNAWLNTADHRLDELERLIDLALHLINAGIE
jgi:hypothetical protein